jgi:hypothetical protein
VLAEGREPILPERWTAAWYGEGLSPGLGEAAASAVSARAVSDATNIRHW